MGRPLMVRMAQKFSILTKRRDQRLLIVYGVFARLKVNNSG